MLSRQLRTPLMPITVVLTMLGKRRDLPAFVTEAHVGIRRNVELETRFVGELLDVTRIKPGKMEIISANMRLHKTIGHAVEAFQSEIRAKGSNSLWS